MLERGVLRIIPGEHHAHLGGHETVGDAVTGDEGIQLAHVVAGLLRDDAHAGARGEGGIHIHHAGVEAVTGIGRHLAGDIQIVILAVPGAEIDKVAMLKHNTLGHARGA